MHPKNNWFNFLENSSNFDFEMLLLIIDLNFELDKLSSMAFKFTSNCDGGLPGIINL